MSANEQNTKRASAIPSTDSLVRLVAVVKQAHAEGYAKGYQDGAVDSGCTAAEALQIHDPWGDEYAAEKVREAFVANTTGEDALPARKDA